MDLVRRARDGDARARDLLLDRYLPLLRRWATGRLPVWARGLVDTDDMIQDTILGTLRNIDHGTFESRHDGALAAYLRQALNNRIRDAIKMARRRPGMVEVDSGIADATASPLERAVGREALQRYDSALARLSDDERALILARVELGLNYQEAAAATGRSTPDAARVAIGRALARLAREMDRG